MHVHFTWHLAGHIKKKKNHSACISGLTWLSITIHLCTFSCDQHHECFIPWVVCLVIPKMLKGFILHVSLPLQTLWLTSSLLGVELSLQFKYPRIIRHQRDCGLSLIMSLLFLNFEYTSHCSSKEQTFSSLKSAICVIHFNLLIIIPTQPWIPKSVSYFHQCNYTRVLMIEWYIIIYSFFKVSFYHSSISLCPMCIAAHS